MSSAVLTSSPAQENNKLPMIVNIVQAPLAPKAASSTHSPHSTKHLCVENAQWRVLSGGFARRNVLVTVL